MTAAAPDRQFAVFARGDQREDLLAAFRNGLRAQLNPETGLPFTEPELTIATARGARWYIEADALDLILLAGQGRAIYLADQVRIDRAGTGFLRGYHGRLWDVTPLGAAGGSGPVVFKGNSGTIFLGSTVLGDPSARVCVDPANLRYQLLFTATADGSGNALLGSGAQPELVGLDTGTPTNLPAGTVLKWTNPPLGATGDVTVQYDFTGGIPEENDADYAKRILDRVRHKQAAGNSSHMRSWVREASNAVEDAVVYPCAFNAGSVLVAVIQKRSTSAGPLARLPSAGTMSAVTAYVTPPASPVVPVPPHVVVVPPVSQPSDLVLSLAMPRGRSSGFADLTPWPQQTGGVAPAISAINVGGNPLAFRFTCSVALPAGGATPLIMIWDASKSRWEKLTVTSIVLNAGITYDVLLSAAPQTTLATGIFVSPYSARLGLIAETIEGYFDSLGPGEVIDLTTDLRAHRAYRFPEPNETLPQRAGSSVIARLQDALGGSLADATLNSISASSPAIPAQVIDGPSVLTCGKVGIYSS